MSGNAYIRGFYDALRNAGVEPRFLSKEAAKLPVYKLPWLNGKIRGAAKNIDLIDRFTMSAGLGRIGENLAVAAAQGPLTTRAVRDAQAKFLKLHRLALRDGRPGLATSMRQILRSTEGIPQGTTLADFIRALPEINPVAA